LFVIYVVFKDDLDDPLTCGLLRELINKNDGELHRIFLGMKWVITVNYCVLTKRFEVQHEQLLFLEGEGGSSCN